MASAQMIHEVRLGEPHNWQLCFQWAPAGAERQKRLAYAPRLGKDDFTTDGAMRRRRDGLGLVPAQARQHWSAERAATR